MYPILILRSEVVCLVILIFLFFTSRSYKIEHESKAFARILNFAILHVLFDIITVLTVNHVDAVPGYLNWLCHVLFYITAILFSNEIANYAVSLCYPRIARKMYYLGLVMTGVYILCLSFLKIEYVADVGTYSSAGPAAIAGYGIAFTFFTSALVMLFTHLKKLPSQVKSALIPMMLVLMITECCQVVWRSVLFTGGAITIVTVGFFFSLENPASVFKKLAMTDALTGVRSRSSYDEDIEKYDWEFRKNPGNDFIFVFCDLNDLRSVNNRFGHAEGDNYISLIASAINNCMVSCTSIYRIGGDEFLIMYYQVDQKTVEKELLDLEYKCAKSSEELDYTAAVATGYAVSSEKYESLHDVIKTADYVMYKNKVKSQSENTSSSHLGTNLNYTGLTDKMFEVMCASDEKTYPFITNLETNITRIAPGWKDFFGLEDEFYEDFVSTWQNHIHPDYLEGYMEDVISVLNGHNKYHNYDYPAKMVNGEYVNVSCHGSLYKDPGTNIPYFTGYIVNKSLNDNSDPITGLNNFEILDSRVMKYMDDCNPFSLLKFKINNFARINMLYGYNLGNEILKKFSELLIHELNGNGEVFCQDSSNFTVFFDTCDENILKEYYHKVSEICASGIVADHGTAPLSIMGGAVINRGERISTIRMRSGLVFALEESQLYNDNRLVFYDSFDEESASNETGLLSRIHAEAMGDMIHFQLRYQPIIDTSSRKTVGAEALLRWIHPSFGEISPAQFISFLENDPCYYRLGLKIIEVAVRDAKIIQERIPEFKISVNITALQLQNEKFTDHILDILKQFDFASDKLVLELTERCKEMDGKFLSRKIAELRSKGIQIAFDDLGTGYSTIKLLLDIPVDEIKLDKDFVNDLLTNESYQFFVKALVLGSSVKGNTYNICFEGIEDEETLEFVSKYGDYLVQGYYFSVPLLFDEFREYLEK